MADAAVRVTTVTTVTVSPEVIGEPQGIQDEPEAQRDHAAPMLTAASVGDHDRRGNYLQYLNRHPFERTRLGLDMSRRVRFRVVDGNGDPVRMASIAIDGAPAGLTHADGVFDYFPSLEQSQRDRSSVVEVRVGNEVARQRVFVPGMGDGQDVVFQFQGAHATAPRHLDLAFVIDVTGSMEDELRYINREVGNIVRDVHLAMPEVEVRVGAILYRDRRDQARLMEISMTSDVEAFSAALARVHASGGGDYPEDMNAGLEAALTRLAWSPSANAVRVLSVIADAPPQHYRDASFTYRSAMRAAAENGIRLLPVAASGANREVEFLFRAMATMTSSPYLYLTDDSGIGGSHMEADTDRVAVEYLHEMLTRLLIDDLQGRGMHEPGPFRR